MREFSTLLRICTLLVPPPLRRGLGGGYLVILSVAKYLKMPNKNRDISLSRTQYDKETSVIASATCCAWQSMTFIVARIFNVITRICVITIANKCFSVIASKNERKRFFARQSILSILHYRLPRIRFC